MNFRGDNESAAKSLRDSVQKARGVMGLGTILQDTKSYIQHQPNGLAERTVQTTRRQANAFLDELREKTKLDIPHTHPILGWAFRCCSLGTEPILKNCILGKSNAPRIGHWKAPITK